MTASEAHVLTSACPLDCPDNCSLDVTVRDGRVERIEGNRHNPVTDGFICTKVRRYDRRLYGPERLLRPGIRTGAKGEGEFEFVSWDEALGRIADRLTAVRDSAGAAAILPFSYGGSNGMLSQGNTDERLFRRLGTSRLAYTVCAAATGRAASGLYGRMQGAAYQDFAHAKLIIVWGANPSASGIHLVPIIKEAQRRGAKLVVIDPRRIPLAAQADVHLALRPGTDLPVALAIHRWLFDHSAADLDFLARHATGVDAFRDRCTAWSLDRAADVAGLDVADLELVARLYAETTPALVRCGWGPERNRNGGSAIAAILALPAVAGKFGVRGGGYTQSNSAVWSFDNDPLVDAPEADTPLVNMNRLGRHLTEDDRCQALFVYNANPLVTLPEQQLVLDGLMRDGLFTVVFDQVLTDTARYADVILPATSFFEHRDMQVGYGSLSLQHAKPVIAPVGEARSNFDVFAELTTRLGLDQPGDVKDTDTWVDHLLAQDPRGREALTRDLEAGAVASPATTATRADNTEGDPGAPIAFVDYRPNTEDSKVHLVPDDLDRETPQGLYTYQDDPATSRYPLALISPATNRTISSTLGELHRKQVPILIHPDDAATRGIEAGDHVRVWNKRGEVRCLASVRDETRPGVLTLAKGMWRHNTLNGMTSNLLVPDDYTDLGEGAVFNDARVEIEKLDTASAP